MPDLPYGLGAMTRRRGDMPDLPVFNMFAEAAPSAERGVVLQSRPGLVQDRVVGSGPIRGQYQADGVLGGARFTVSGTKLYREAVELGTISGDGPVSFAASPTEILVNAGQDIHRYDGTAFTTVDFPDDAAVSKVIFLAGYFVALRKDTQQWYFSAVLNGASWDGFDFANAENEPDRLVDAVVMNDILVLLGTASVEFWPGTGNADLPFRPIEGRVYEKGCRATGCATVFDNAFAWVGSNSIVYLGGNVPVRVSDSGVEEDVAASTDCAVWRLQFEGHDFLVLRLDTQTRIYDAQSQQWTEWGSWQKANFRAQNESNGLFGDDATGQLWRFEGHRDPEGVLERRFRGGIPIGGGVLPVDNVRLLVNMGQAPDLNGEYANPLVEMRSSRDAGKTWSVWRSTALGAQGAYRTMVEWRRCGRFDYPGALFEFRVTDPVPFRVSTAKFNEIGGGRGR